MDFQQSRTFINLQMLYEIQLKSSAKYDMFGITASNEILIEIANMFDTIARNQRVVAERLRNLLLGGESNTLENLFESRDDQVALTNLYREYSTIAVEEGYEYIASLFNGIANIQMNHNNYFQTTATDLTNNQFFCKAEDSLWICIACGNIMNRVCAPERCPVCGYPQGYYQLLRE